MRAGAIDNLFARFDKHLSRSGYLAKGGQIIDATIIQAPKQHNSQDEKAAIKAGEIPPEWKDKPASSRRRTARALDGKVFQGEAADRNTGISRDQAA